MPNKNVAPKIFAKFSGKHQSWNLYKVAGKRLTNFLKQRLRHSYFPVNFAKFWKVSLLWNTYERLLLNFGAVVVRVKFTVTRSWGPVIIYLQQKYLAYAYFRTNTSRYTHVQKQPFADLLRKKMFLKTSQNSQENTLSKYLF